MQATENPASTASTNVTYWLRTRCSTLSALAANLKTPKTLKCFSTVPVRCKQAARVPVLRAALDTAKDMHLPSEEGARCGPWRILGFRGSVSLQKRCGCAFVLLAVVAVAVLARGCGCACACACGGCASCCCCCCCCCLVPVALLPGACCPVAVAVAAAAAAVVAVVALIVAVVICRRRRARQIRATSISGHAQVSPGSHHALGESIAGRAAQRTADCGLI